MAGLSPFMIEESSFVCSWACPNRAIVEEGGNESVRPNCVSLSLSPHFSSRRKRSMGNLALTKSVWEFWNTT